MKRQIKRASIAIIGGIVVIFGIFLIPYPGPGWLVVFAGLGILATEFEWAQRALKSAKAKYDTWVQWVVRQKVFLKLLISLFAAAIVVITIWLINGYGVINHLFHLNIDWVDSPIPIFHTK